MSATRTQVLGLNSGGHHFGFAMSSCVTFQKPFPASGWEHLRTLLSAVSFELECKFR